MTTDSMHKLHEEILRVLLPCGAERVALFGSVARGTESTTSDVDLLVRFRKPVGLFALAHMQHVLAERLGRSVDLVTEGALSPHLRPYVERDQVVIYEE